MGFLSNHDRPKSMKEPRGIDALGQDVASAYYVRVGDGLRDALQGIRAANWQLEEEIIAQLALKKQGCEALDPETAQIALEVARRAAALAFSVDGALSGAYPWDMYKNKFTLDEIRQIIDEHDLLNKSESWEGVDG